MNKKKEQALEIIRILKGKGYEAYFAGGCVRDMVMEKEPHDYDIATSALPEEVMTIFSRTVPVGAQFGVVLVLTDENQFEVATFRSDVGYTDGRRPTKVRFTSSREDVLRRDFTVNGLLYDTEKDKMIDYVDGVKDIHQKLIRTIGDPYKRFEEDKLRLIRAVRFSANLNFEIEEQTFKTLTEYASQIQVVSAERIRDELVKIFTGAYPSRGLELLDRSGLLKIILPEVEAMKGVEQPPEFHPEGDVFIHTKMMLDQLKNADLVLAFSCLLHDVGKPLTQSFKDRIRFNDHENVGGRMTEKILRRLRFSNHDIEQIVDCVANHMRFKDVQRMREARLKRMMAKPTFLAELEMHRLDCMASHGIICNWEFLKKKYEEFEKEPPPAKPLITGKDLIEMGYVPGPKFKEILTAAEDAYLEKRLSNLDEAKNWVNENFKH